MAKTDPDRIALLANPASGRGRGAARLREALTLLCARGIRPRVLATQAAGEAVALEREERTIDVWLWNETRFVNVVGMGLDAAVARTANERFRRLTGAAAYTAALAVTLPGFRPFRLGLEWPGGEWAGRAWLAAFA